MPAPPQHDLLCNASFQSLVMGGNDQQRIHRAGLGFQQLDGPLGMDIIEIRSGFIRDE